jgi:uncharacterized alpha-E superfamily protein
MLSRVANSLFWLSRYVERAENAARFLSVTDAYARELQGVSRAAAEAVGQAAWAHLAPGETMPEGAGGGELQRLVFDTELPGSVYASITLARENARSIRDAIPTETWEALNVLFLRLQEEAPHRFTPTRRQALLHQVREAAWRMQGLRDNVMVRADEWNFQRLGCFLERADNTLRLLGTMFFHPALQVASDSGQSIDALHLAAVLRMCTAFETFSRTAAGLSTERVIEFLFLDARFPRSVAFAFEELQRALHALSQTPEDVYTNDAEQLCGRLAAELRFASVQEILHFGLRATLDRVLGTVGQIGGAVHQEYFA